MGKGNRTRNDRYDEVYNMSGGSKVAVKSNKQGAKKDYTSAIMIAIIAVLILAALALFIFSDTGFLKRNTVYVSSDNYEVTGTMLPYYENLIWSSTFEQYYYYYYMYTGDATQAGNAAQQLMSQYSLDDFFDSAIETSKEMVALAEEAKAKGIELDQEDMNKLEETLADYSSASFGKGVKKKDIRRALELQMIAGKYSEIVYEDIEGSIGDADVLAYIEENKPDYYSADYLKYELVLKAEDYEDNAEEYARVEQLVDKFANIIAEAKDENGFKKAIITYEIEKSFDYLIANNKGDLEVPDKATADAAKQAIIDNTYDVVVLGEPAKTSFTENQTYQELFKNMAQSLVTTCRSSLSSLEGSSNFEYASEDEVVTWLSDEATKTGDGKVFDKSSEDEYAKAVYLVTEAMHLDVSETKDVAHILIKVAENAAASTKAEAKAKAEKVLDEFLAGEQTKEAFEKLAETYNEDSGCVYENVTNGQMVESFDAWTFDAARKTGDTAVVETEFGYHVMYFIGEGEAPYYSAALSAYSDDKYALLIKELTEKHVTVNQKEINKNTAETTGTTQTTKAA